MWTEFDSNRAGRMDPAAGRIPSGGATMGNASVICPKCGKPGFSWGRRRCMYCANPSEDFDPRIVHEFPPENDRIYLRLLEGAKRNEEIESGANRRGAAHV